MSKYKTSFDGISGLLTIWDAKTSQQVFLLPEKKLCRTQRTKLEAIAKRALKDMQEATK